MNEHTICSKLKAEFEKVLPRAVVFKHADTSTISVPDLSITDDRRTTWLEVKFVRAKRGAAYITSKQAQDNTHQHAMMLKLEHSAYDAWYVIITRNGLRSFNWNLILPSELFKHDRITLQNPTPTIDYRGIVSRL